MGLVVMSGLAPSEIRQLTLVEINALQEWIDRRNKAQSGRR